MISDELLADCHRLVDDIAPELSRSIYIVDAASLPEKHGGSVLGICFPAASAPHLIRSILQEADVWEGEIRPSIFLNQQAISEQYGYGPDFRRGLLATMVHELAHAVAYEPVAIDNALLDVTDCEGVRQKQSERIEAHDAIRSVVRFGHEYFGHNADFIRRACHLQARAKLAGWEVADSVWFDSIMYAAKEPFWIWSLLDEIHEHLTSSFDVIAQTPPPDAFVEMVEHLKETTEYYRTKYA